MDSSILISIFGFEIRWYGLVYALGFLLSYWYFIKFFKDKHLNDDEKDSVFFIIAITSLIFARLTYCFAYFPEYYFFNPLDIFKIWQGGMSINGGFLGFFISIYILSKKYKFSLYKLTDFFILPGILALAFGRLGNFFNQELVGIPYTGTFSMVFEKYDDISRFPYQVFAGLKNLIAFEILLYLHLFKKLKTGALTLIAALLYSIGRFFLDFMREPTTYYLGFPLGQWFSLIIIIISSYLLYKLHKK